MRRTRRDVSTKVWHNPEITGRRGVATPKPSETPEDRRASKQHRAALEALFAPKKDPAEIEEPRKSSPALKGRVVLPPPPVADSRGAERQKLLGKLLGAEGRPNVSKAANDFLRAGFTFPEEQDVQLKLLEHADEEHVRSAIAALSTLLAGELPKRRAVLESRLRRIEEFAEESATRTAAERLRRQVTGRAEPSSPPGA